MPIETLTVLAHRVLIDIVIIDKLQTEVVMEAIRWFEEIVLADIALVEGKGANLPRMPVTARSPA